MFTVYYGLAISPNVGQVSWVVERGEERDTKGVLTSRGAGEWGFWCPSRAIEWPMAGDWVSEPFLGRPQLRVRVGQAKMSLEQ